MGNSASLFDGITKGMNEASLIVACISDEYVKSRSCVLEFRFAHCSLKVPILKAIVGTGNEWKKHEISFLSGSYPEVSFQFENRGKNTEYWSPNTIEQYHYCHFKRLKYIDYFTTKDAHEQLLNLVKKELEKARRKEVVKLNENMEIEKVEKNASAFQELYELTQRKFLRRLAQFADKMYIGLFPRLIFIDLIEREKVQSSVKDMLEDTKRPHDDRARLSSDRDDANSLFNEDSRGFVNYFRQDTKNTDNEASIKSKTKKSPYMPCLRIMCEYEEGWHRVETYSILNELKNSFCPYLSRMMNLLKK
jgi:hypothetical protein